MAHGIAIPCMIIVFGDMLDSFLDADEFCKNCTTTGKPLIDYYNLNANTFKDNLTCDTFLRQNPEAQEHAKFVLVTFSETLRFFQLCLFCKL